MFDMQSEQETERFVLDAVRRLVRVLREASRSSERAVGISSAQLFVLHQLRGGETLTINDLAVRTLTHQSSVSVVVSRLLEEKLVRRAPSVDDARRSEVSLTAKGRELLARAPAVEQIRLVDGLRRMKPAQRQSLCVGLSAWLEAMGLVDAEPEMFFEDPPRPKPKKTVRRGAAVQKGAPRA